MLNPTRAQGQRNARARTFLPINIASIFGKQIAAMEDVHPKLYPGPCLPPSLPPPTHTHYDQDKREFRRAILSGDRSCYLWIISQFDPV